MDPASSTNCGLLRWFVFSVDGSQSVVELAEVGESGASDLHRDGREGRRDPCRSGFLSSQRVIGRRFAGKRDSTLTAACACTQPTFTY